MRLNYPTWFAVILFVASCSQKFLGASAIPAWQVQNATKVNWHWGYFEPTNEQKTRYACVTAPSVPYCLSDKTDDDCAAVQGVSCQTTQACMTTCEKSCSKFSDVHLSTSGAGEFYTGYKGVTFPGICLPSVDAVEGTLTSPLIHFEPLGWKLDFNGTGPSGNVILTQQNLDLDYSTTIFKVQMTARYGNWSAPGCTTTVESQVGYGTPGAVTILNYKCITAPGEAKTEYAVSTGLNPSFRTISFIGTVEQVVRAMHRVQYIPDEYQNSLRLRAKHLNPVSCFYQPYETWVLNVSMGPCSKGTPDACSQIDPTQTTYLPIFETLVNIIAVNNAPILTDPQYCYFRPGCKGDVRSVTIVDGGSGYRQGTALLADCDGDSKCLQCISQQFVGNIIVDAKGTITGFNISKRGAGFRTQFAPTMKVQNLTSLGLTNGVGAVLVPDIADGECTYPQTESGSPMLNNVFPDEVKQYENCQPEPDCSAGNAFSLTPSLKTYSYHFGQFWRYEDRGESLLMDGIESSDVDAYESCGYYNEFCTGETYFVRAQLGVPILNRQADINLYITLRSEYDWTSNLFEATNALRGLRYTIEREDLLGPGSLVFNYNSQALGSRPEFLVIGQSDQGYTGASGLSKCFLGDEWVGMGAGSSLTCGLRINVTIVGVNDAPIITTPDGTYYTPRENIPYVLQNLGVKDVDVYEETTSSMAIWDWINLPGSANALNKIKIRLKVEKGILLLNPVARQITATMNSTQLWITITRYMAGHDTCRLLTSSCLQDPYSCTNSTTFPKVTYQQVCSFRENTPETARLAMSSCESSCTCLIANDCANTGQITLFLNTTKEQHGELNGKYRFMALLFDSLGLYDATCGGMAFYQEPNNFSWGKRCKSNLDCQAPNMAPVCIPGVTCKCCADLSVTCSSTSDCVSFKPYDTCGCTAGLDPPCKPGVDCFCCNNMSVTCRSDDDCGVKAVGLALSNRSVCGCNPQRHSICGPYGQSLPDGGDPDMIIGSKTLLTGGTPCTYRFPDSNQCLPPFRLSLGTQDSDILAFMQTDGSSTLEFFGPLKEINDAISFIRYNTSSALFPNYNKHYRPPIPKRPADFDIEQQNDDLLTFYAHDMGNTGGTGRRCMLCEKHASCNSDCSSCSSQGELAFSGCWVQSSFTVSVFATNNPPAIVAPSYVVAVEGESFSFLNTDQLVLSDGLLELHQGSDYVAFYASPSQEAIDDQKACNDTAGQTSCARVWGPVLTATDAQFNQGYPKFIYQHLKTAITITDPDWTDFGYDDLFLTVNLSCSHGRLFLNETFLQEIAFNGNLQCDLNVDPLTSPMGCRIRLKDYGHPQGKVGLYARISGPTSTIELSSKCPSITKVIRPRFPYLPTTFQTITPAQNMPFFQDSFTTSSYGCPCYSHVLFNPVGEPLNPDFSFCSVPIDSNGVSMGKVAILGNKFISIEGRLKDLVAALSNVTYVPDPYFNTGVPGNYETIHISVDDQGALGDVLRGPKSTLIPPPSLTDAHDIIINITAVNNPPRTGRLISLTCDPKLPGRKKACPLGPSDPETVKCTGSSCQAQDMRQLTSWTQVPAWPKTNLNLNPGTKMVLMNISADYIDVDEDTIFAVTPDVLWIDDPDSGEAAIIYDNKCSSNPTKNIIPTECLAPTCTISCLQPYGQALYDKYICTSATARPGVSCLGPNDKQTCLCNTLGCTNPSPLPTTPCQLWLGQLTRTQTNPGQLYVEIKVQHGRLTFYPQPPQFPESLLPDYMLYTNGSANCYWSQGCVNMMQCPVETACIFNVTTLRIVATLERLQFALSNRFLTYVGNLNYYGTDTLDIWISDVGYTSDTYNMTHVTTLQLPIRIVAINDPPVIIYPPAALQYQKGLICRTNYQLYALLQGTYCGALEGNTFNRNITALPPTVTRGVDPGSISVFDQDMNALSEQCPNGCGNITVSFRFDRPGTASIYFSSVRVLVQYSEYIDSGQLTWTRVWGKMSEVNLALQVLFYDAQDGYQGYAPLTLYADDMANYGQCAPDTKCAKYDPITNLQVVPCSREQRMPCTPVAHGTTTAQIDTVIGALQQCAYTDCLNCNRDKNCGWCPTTCGGAGKCMIGLGKPTFDICPGGKAFSGTDYETSFGPGEGYGLCQRKKLDIAAIIGAVIPSALLLALLIYTFVRWVQRRHGTLWNYLAKKQFDIVYHGRKMYLVAPEGARYDKLAFVLVWMLIGGLISSGDLLKAAEGPYDLKQAFFLDKAVSLHMALDNCAIRFLPASHASGSQGDAQLTAIKVRFAYPTKQDIQLVAEVCDRDVGFEIVNGLADDVKYLDYWCNIDILVPDLTVIPSVFITAKGSNLTTVRGGPMDPDTRNFGLDFGPNTLSIQGHFVQARLQNVTAKAFVFNVVHGSLLGVDLGNGLGGIPKAEFTSVDADMVVTTLQMTTARIWHRSDANLMCVGAAEGSLYMEEPCKEVCDFVKAPETSKQLDPSLLAVDDFEQCPKLRPLIPGCYDPITCKPISSQRCYCVPACEAPYSSINGQCQSDGTCCHQSCGGYYSFDLFPTVNQTRCGTCINPVTMPWSAGRLLQQWRFTSETGMISLQAGSVEGTDPPPSLFSYKGGAPLPPSQIQNEVDIYEADKAVLDAAFHAAGAPAPLSQWFWLPLSGAGAPEFIDGQFAWLVNVRYLVLPQWLLDVFTLTLLTPTIQSAAVSLNPGFCPGYLKRGSAAASERLVTLYTTIVKALQTYPEDQVQRPLVYLSLIAWFSAGGDPTIFTFDTSVNKFKLTQVDPKDYPSMMSIVIVILIFPALITIAFIGYLAKWLMDELEEFRNRKLLEEATMANLGLIVKTGCDTSEEDAEDMLISRLKNEVNPTRLMMMRATTNFFYMSDEWFSGGHVSRNTLGRVIDTTRDLTLIAAPVAFILYAASLIKSAIVVEKCFFRLDKRVCESEPIMLVLAMQLVCLAYVLVCVAELAIHYLCLPVGKAMLIFRHVFYAVFFFFHAIGTFLVMICIFWILVGVLIQPYKMLPYAIALICFLAGSAAAYAKNRRLQLRVQRGVREGLEIYEKQSRIRETVPKAICQVLINNKRRESMHKNGFSNTKVAIRSIVQSICLGLALIFVLFGVKAFMDESSRPEAILNASLLVSVTSVFMWAAGDDADRSWTASAIEKVTNRVLHDIQNVLTQVMIQVQTILQFDLKIQRMNPTRMTGGVDDERAGPGGQDRNNDLVQRSVSDTEESDLDGSDDESRFEGRRLLTR